MRVYGCCVRHLSVTSHQRAVRDVEERVPQSVPASFRQRLSAITFGTAAAATAAVVVVVVVLMSGISLISSPKTGINLHHHTAALLVTCYLSVIVVFYHDNSETKTLPGLMHKCTTRVCYTHTHTHIHCLLHPPRAVVPLPLSFAPLKSYSHDAPNPTGPLPVPRWTHLIIIREESAAVPLSSGEFATLL